MSNYQYRKFKFRNLTIYIKGLVLFLLTRRHDCPVVVVSGDNQGAVMDATRRQDAVAPGLFEGTQFQTRQEHRGVDAVAILVDVVAPTQPHKHVAVGVEIHWAHVGRQAGNKM